MAALLPLLAVRCLTSADLKPATVSAFDQYIRQAEQRLDARKTFLWADEVADRAGRARKGEVLVEPTGAKPLIAVTDGLIHDWIGTIFIPGATLAQTIGHLQEYNRSPSLHREVIASHILSRDGNDFKVYMRLLKKKIITVVLDTDHDIRYIPIDATHWKSQSHTTKIAEVQNAGKKDEKELPAGTGEGFLWKLNTYWRFEQRDGGMWIECEAISLTRDIPTGLGWLIEPIIRSLPKDSLENTLRETAAGESVHK
jgi:hypothetical protein